MKKVLSMVLAGGKGERLYPLTRDRAKPAVSFGGTYRIIDFTISNCMNSGFRKIYVLTQYKSLSLDRHIQRAWNFLNNRIGEFVYIIHPQQRVNENWYKGTADAIYQNFYTLQQERPDLVLILSGDHIYKMDYQKLIDYHLKMKADLTVSVIETDKSESKNFGVLQIDRNQRITGFQEKPAKPKTIPDKPGSILINMGVYVFNTEVLVTRLIENAKRLATETQHDFGKDIIPSMLKTSSVYAFPFADKRGAPMYWKDVGTIDAYYDASIDLLNTEIQSGFFERAWPFYTYEKQAPPAQITGLKIKDDQTYGLVTNSIISKGCIINRANINQSVLSPFVNVDHYSTVQNSILMDDVKVGRKCQIQKAIIDKGVIIPNGTEIGYNRAQDLKKYTVTDSGIVVIPKNSSF